MNTHADAQNTLAELRIFPTARVLDAVWNERKRQARLQAEGRFQHTLSDVLPPVKEAFKLAVLAEEFGEVAREVCELGSNGKRERAKHLARLYEELVQVAAVAVAWCEAIEDELTERP